MFRHCTCSWAVNGNGTRRKHFKLGKTVNAKRHKTLSKGTTTTQKLSQNSADKKSTQLNSYAQPRFVRAINVRVTYKIQNVSVRASAIYASRHFGTVFLTLLLNISSIYFQQSRMKTFSYLNLGFFQCRAPSICVRIIPEPMHVLPRLCLSVSSVKKPRRICRD